MGAVAAAGIMRRERLIVDAYRDAGAISPERARTPDELLIHAGFAFRRLIDHAVLRDVGDGRYFLDEPSWKALRGIRRRLAFVVALVALIIASGALIASGIIAR
jgi:hypothetical protein